MSKLHVSNKDREKNYFKYYLKDLTPGPAEKYEKISKGPLDNSIAPRIENRNDLFNPGYFPEEFGLWQLEDGTVVIANHTMFARQTTNRTSHRLPWETWYGWR